MSMNKYLIEQGVLTKYEGPGGQVIVPDGVTAIGVRAFDRTGVTSVTLPTGISVIHERAFFGCSALTDISLPEGLDIIEGEAFSGCRALNAIALPRSLTHIGEDAFSGCSGLTEVALPQNLTFVSVNTFLNCRSLSKLTLPEGLERIERSAFSGCRALKEVALPSTLTDIGEFAFHNCGLTDLPKGPSLKRLERSAFSQCHNLTEVTLPEGLEKLERGVFYGCANLTDVYLPEGVTNINKGAFLQCNALVRIHADPNNPNYRDMDGMLYSKDGTCLIFCPNGLSDVTIPEGVTEIGTEAFADGDLLEQVHLPQSLQKIGSCAFSRSTKLATIALPENLAVIGEAAFSFCSALTTMIIPNSVNTIEGGSFQKCTALKWIQLPKAVSFDLHWFVNPHDPTCRSADHTTVPFVTTRPCSDIISNLGMRYAGIGFILADIAGVKPEPQIAEGYITYIRENLELFHKELLTDVEILQWMFDHDMIRQQDIEGLLAKAAHGGHTAASAALLDYQNKTFSPKDQDKLMDLRFEQLFEDALDL